LYNPEKASLPQRKKVNFLTTLADKRKRHEGGTEFLLDKKKKGERPK
jgi:hypothetical protein